MRNRVTTPPRPSPACDCRTAARGLGVMWVRSIRALCVSGVFCALGLMIWPGCATPPLRSIRKPIADRKKADFAFLKSTPLSREEVVAKVGVPDACYADLRVCVYRINDVTRRNLLLCLFVIPMGVQQTPGGRGVGVRRVRRAGPGVSRGDYEFFRVDGDEARGGAMGGVEGEGQGRAVRGWSYQNRRELKMGLVGVVALRPAAHKSGGTPATTHA